jgi:hypothetical protein
LPSEDTAVSKKPQEETFSLDEENFPAVLAQYGLEGAKNKALSMCEAQNIEPTLTNMYLVLANLEITLSIMFSYSGFDIDEEFEKKKRTSAQAEAEKREIQEYLLIHNAIIFAAKKQDGQKRKGTDIPYISHPMEVMGILIANGCSETVIAAGILHDTLEDTETARADFLVCGDILRSQNA